MGSDTWGPVVVTQELRDTVTPLTPVMNGHEEAAQASVTHTDYTFTQKVSNSFADSILATSPGKPHGAMGDGCDSGEGEGDLMERRGEESPQSTSPYPGEEDWPHPTLQHCVGRKEGDSGFISPEGVTGQGRETGGKALDSSMDSEDAAEDKDDEKEKEERLVNTEEDYNYQVREDTGCTGKEENDPLLDLGQECEVESLKLQEDRIGGEKGEVKNDSPSSSEDEEDNLVAHTEKTNKGSSSSSSSEDEAEDVTKNPVERKASSCYSTSDGEEKEDHLENEKDSEDEAEFENKKEQNNDHLNEALIPEDSASEDEHCNEKETMVEKKGTEEAEEKDVKEKMEDHVDLMDNHLEFESHTDLTKQTTEVKESSDCAAAGEEETLEEIVKDVNTEMNTPELTAAEDHKESKSQEEKEKEEIEEDDTDGNVEGEEEEGFGKVAESSLCETVQDCDGTIAVSLQPETDIHGDVQQGPVSHIEEEGFQSPGEKVEQDKEEIHLQMEEGQIIDSLQHQTIE